MCQQLLFFMKWRWLRKQLGCFCGLLLIYLLLHLRVGNGDQTLKSRSITEYRPGPLDSSDSLLVVTLLGGNVVAVRPDSGEILWEYDTGKPLVRVSQGKAMPPGLRMLSGVDGGLYLLTSALAGPTGTDGAPAGGRTLERLPISLPELVEASPSLTADGSIITGERRTRVFALDRRTGALLHVFSNGEDGASTLAGLEDPLLRSQGPFGGMGDPDVPVLQMMDPDRILLVGRQDFVVRSKQMLTDVEAWNASYSRMVNLRAPGFGVATRAPEAGGFGGEGGAASGASHNPSSGTAGGTVPLFAVGADHTLQAFDPASRLRRWALRFNTPPVGVFTAAHGDINFLEPTALYPPGNLDVDATTTTVATTQGRRRRGGPGVSGTTGGRDGGGGGGNAQQSMVLVGEVKGSWYAMPAEHVVLDERLEPQPWNVLALPARASEHRVADSRPLPLLPSSTDGGDGKAPPATDKAIVVRTGSSSKDLVAYARDVETGEGVVSGLICSTSSTWSTGMQVLATLGEPTGVRQPWLPKTAKTSNGSGAGSSGSGNRPAVALPMAFDGGGSAGDLLTVVLAAATGFGAAVVLAVMHFRSGGAKVAAAAAAAVTAAGVGGDGKSLPAPAAIDVAAAATATAMAGGTAATAAAAKNGAGSGVPSGSRSNAIGRGRRKGRASGSSSNNSNSSSSNSEGLHDGSSNPVSTFPTSHVDLLSIPEDMEASPAPSGGPGSASAPPAGPLDTGQSQIHVRGDGSLVIGRLVVGPGILGYGSAGTIVYEGVLNGRPVAVKRLLRQFTELARKEIEVLILSDEHPNVVRCFALEEDREFVYLALEKCRSTLSGFLETAAGRDLFVDPDTRQPTARCLSTLLDMCQGLAALHERGIVHRDLKPHNVLLTESGNRAKLSDMGLCKQLVPEQSSFESHHGPGGSSGWQAPEQLIARDGGAARQSRSMDVFSLGCILYYCMTGGRHPFGDNHYERDARILRGDPVLLPLLAAGAEAFNLVASCLAREPVQRPVVAAILCHPVWWSDERRLSFLMDISDRVENEDREPDTSLLAAMESYAGVALAVPGAEVLGGSGAATTAGSSAAGGGLAAALAEALSSSAVPNWGACLPAELVANLGRYRRYDFTSLRDLLRVVRNKRNHFREMPPALQVTLGPLPGGFLRFFTGRFPCLLLAVYVFALQHLADESSMQQYWGQGAGVEGAEPFVRTFMASYGTRMRPIKTAQQQQPQQQQQGGVISSEVAGTGVGSFAGSEDSVAAGAAAPALASALAEMHPDGKSSDTDDGSSSSPTSASAAAVTTATAPTLNSLPPSLPSCRPPPNGLPATLPNCADATTGPTSAALMTPAPPPVPSQPPPLVLVGYEPADDDGELMVREFPRRPGKQLCDFYMKTGHCKFGETCVFDHPIEYAVPLTVLGLPLRPEEQICTFYLKNNDCRFGPACKFHHPMLRPVFAGSAMLEGAGIGVGVVKALDDSF